MKKCPFCAEEIQDQALKCKHCGSNLTGKTSAHPKKGMSPIRGCFTVLVAVFVLFILIPTLFHSSPPVDNNDVAGPRAKQLVAESSPEVAEAATPDKIVTMAKFNKIKDGMSMKQVVAIIGHHGKLMSHVAVGGIITEMYQWQNADFTNMTIQFQNDKVVTKAQFGL